MHGPFPVYEAEPGRDILDQRTGTMKYYIGVDPDCGSTGIALLQDGRLDKVFCARYHPAISMALAISLTVRDIGSYLYAFTRICECQLIIEDQEIAYSARIGVNPRSMIPLAQVAGMAAGAASYGLTDDIEFVKPSVWKGSVPKHVQQARTFEKLGIPFWTTDGNEPYCIPTVAIAGADFPDGLWKHVADAVGIALWAYERDMLKERMERARTSRP
jgi:hypothetical protein